MEKINCLLKFSIRCAKPGVFSQIRCNHTTNFGGGAGKGGGAGGSIREAGGGLGKMAAANEEKFFYDLQKQQIEDLKQDGHHKVQSDEQQTQFDQKRKANDEMFLAKMKKE